MEEQVARFVSRDQKQPLPPPPADKGIFGRMRKNLFATPLDAILTVAAGVFIVWAAWHLIQWALVSAVFTGSDRSACVGEEVGACWIFVSSKFEQFIYGLYPIESRWRVDVFFVLLVALIAPMAMPSAPHKKLNALLLFAVFPFVALVLLTGGRFDLSGGTVALVVLIAAIATLAEVAGLADMSWKSLPLRVAAVLVGVAAVAFMLSGLSGTATIRVLEFRFTGVALASATASLGAVGVLVVAARGREGASLMGLLIPLLTALGFLFLLTADFGLRPVRTSLWGGLLVTLVVAISGIAASLPLGVLLALGRRSEMPAIRLLCVIFIEFWRGVPLITVLFMANFMLPLFVPDGVQFNQLLRVLVGVALFSAAYMAEVIRGGLQAIPKGQYEGADAMALTYWQKMRIIILPQALTLVIPGIVNTFIGLFKDTSLVYIVGLADFLGTVRRGFSDPNWITTSTPATGLVFAAFVYWVFCFGMSRYSIFMERRLDTGHKQ